MVYPIIILVATLGITSILAFFIFPKILPILTSINVELPLVTVWFIAISSFMTAYGIWVILGIIGFVIAFIFSLRINLIRFFWHQVSLVVPFVSDMVIHVNLINFSRTLGLLLKAGIRIVEAIEITSNTLPNLLYQKEVKLMAEGVKKGDQLSKYLVANEHLFPPIFSQMVVVGENTGKLEESLLFLADFYEGEMDETTKSLSNFLEPILLLIMGGIVGFVALAIITPIYKITQTLGR